MKSLLSIWLAGLCSVAGAMSGPDDRQATDPKSVVSVAKPEARLVRIEDLYRTRSISSAALSPNGEEVALTTDLTGRINLWKMSSSGSWPVQLVSTDERQRETTWSPDGHWIAYAQDKGGDELWDIFVISSDGGSPTNLTDTPDVREQHPVWSHDGRSIACEVKPKAAPSYDIALIDPLTHKVRKLTGETNPQEGWSVIGFSPDDKFVYANRTDIGREDGDVVAIDIATGSQKNLTAHQGKKLNMGSAVSPDGAEILMTSDRKGGFHNAALLEPATQRVKWVTDTRWQVTSGAFSQDGRYFTYAISADGRHTLHLVDRRTLKTSTITSPLGSPSFRGAQHLTHQGREILFLYEALNSPADLWTFDTRSGRTRPITRMASGGIGPKTLPPAHIVHYQSFDGTMISAVLQMPFNLKRNGKSPLVIYPHGGPTEQTDDWWDQISNALATRGYIVLQPNPRGSTGYGQAFQKANYQDLGGADLKDLLAGIDWVLRTGYVDTTRVGSFGGSYGGFLTLMLAAKAPTRIGAAVDLYGPLDFVTMLEHADPWLAEYVRSLLGDPVKDREVYKNSSVITYVKEIRAPLLVLQGDNDTRIPKEESERLVDMLRKQGNTVDVVYYPNEGHGFEKVEDQIDAAKRTVDWFDRYLKGTSP